MSRLSQVLILVVIVLVSFFSYGVYAYHNLSTTLQDTRGQLASTTAALEEKTTILTEAQNENTNLNTRLGGEIARNDFFNEQIQNISSTVGTLDKLSKTDRELLQKYSNVYFLNENYIPSALAGIDEAYLYRKDKIEQIHISIKTPLQNLITAANSESIPLLVLSGYRSFGTQANLKTNYKITYGTTAANRFSADQGYSEHQLGSTVDFTTSGTGELLSSFEKTSAFEWLVQNAYKYGFVLSYPKGNKFFQYEPWHWRFVGVELATKLHADGKHFYDMDQREINAYLVKIFD